MCIHIYVYILNGLVLVCNQGLEKLHLLLLKPPLPLHPPCAPTPKPWQRQICFLCLQFGFHHGITDMAWSSVWLFCLAPFPWCNVLKINLCYFPFQKYIPFHCTNRLQGSQCEAIKALEH